ncbi:MAG: ParA family protein, partial [Saccharolobus sp.]
LKDQETKISALLGNDEILIKPARFIIPFYPSLIRRHFKDVNPPDEILKLATYINDLIREPKSIL